MSKIICMLENASDLINGIKFAPVDGVDGLVSEEVEEPITSLFLSIPGYSLFGAESEVADAPEVPQKPAVTTPAKETAAERKARLAAEKAEKEEVERLAAEQDSGEGEGEGEDNAQDGGEGSDNAGDGEVF